MPFLLSFPRSKNMLIHRISIPPPPCNYFRGSWLAPYYLLFWYPPFPQNSQWTSMGLVYGYFSGNAQLTKGQSIKSASKGGWVGVQHAVRCVSFFSPYMVQWQNEWGGLFSSNKRIPQEECHSWYHVILLGFLPVSW